MIGKLKDEILFIWGTVLVTVISHLSFSNYFSNQSLGMLLSAILVGYSFRAFFTKLFSLHLMLVTGLLFYGVSNIKFANMGRVIEGRDLRFLGQAADVSDYLPWLQIGLAVLLLGSLIIHKKKLKLNYKLFPLPLILAIGVFFYSQNTAVYAKTNDVLKRSMNVHVDFWSAKSNLETNGIFLHLLQTSPTSILPKSGAHNFYSKRAEPRVVNYNNPDVFYVICESCFYNPDPKSPFHNSMRKISDLGLSLFDMVSPTYGGGTSEAEFELLTGLPASGLVGIKYQVYGGSFSENSKTVARSFLDSGYRTYFMHNTPASHWRRDEVVPKFGFEESYYIDSMTNVGNERWARDEALYLKALEHYKIELAQQSPKPVFMNLLAVYSHGGYDPDENYGVGSFNKKIDVVVKDFIAFYKEVENLAKKHNRKTIFIVLGDHKPSLLEAFEVYGEIPSTAIHTGVGGLKTLSHQLNVQEKIAVGKMPVFVTSKFAASFSLDKNLEMKPFFCLPAYLSLLVSRKTEDFLGSIRYYCDAESVNNLNDESFLQNLFVEELYFENLFK